MARSEDNSKIVRLKDYKPPSFTIQKTQLHFDLASDSTLVTSTLHIVRLGKHDLPLRLDGEDLQLLELRLGDKALTSDEYKIAEEYLEIPNVPNEFILTVKNRISPETNTRLEGLYLSGGIYCTQCEAEGFRRITYFIDRPDVMSIYDVTISAPLDFTAVLSNGNLISDETKDNRRVCRWQDPFPKPCYLFALVAGRLACVSDDFTTASGRQVALNIYLAAGYEARAAYAMEALKHAMRWDEERFGLEYDLDLFNIVAIEDFNMGAMENKSLNVFNAKYVLAAPDTATDMDYLFIESIIGHEYFHNWSGNRVTCRDWFQLSLKEGLTVFRDQEFSADRNSRSTVRIVDVMRLKDAQFPEDAGKLSHPVRPSQYIEINNFYTATVYEKGAEVVRMLHSLLGEQGFRQGLSLYFTRHDGQAVTCDDFITCMRDANSAELQDFELWYSQSGTPRIAYEEHYDSKGETYHLKIRQHTPPTNDSKTKRALPIPLQFALLDKEGKAYPITPASPESGARLKHVEGKDYILLTEDVTELTFNGITAPPQLSLNRGFSAPVIVETEPSEDKLAFHIAKDDDAYLRWEAAQNYSMRILGHLIGSPDYDVERRNFGYFDAYKGALDSAHDDPAFAALLLALPSESVIADNQDIVDVQAIHDARKNLQKRLGIKFGDEFAALYRDLKSTESYAPNLQQIGRRALRNLALTYRAYRATSGEMQKEVLEHYFSADNMTDKIAAMQILADDVPAVRQEVFEDFYKSFKNDAIVLDKWFALQARSHADDALANIKALSKSKDFNIKNPNRLRSLVGTFAFGNALKFNAPDGSGYDFVLEILRQVDALNPQTCARLLGAFAPCDRLPKPLKQIAKDRLQVFRESSVLSKDSSEIIGKMLG